MACSLAAAPCSGPAILGLLLLFGTQNNILLLVLMFIVLAIVVMIPYLAIALVTGEARNRIATKLASSARTLEYIVGALLILIGIILMYPWVSFVISTWV